MTSKVLYEGNLRTRAQHLNSGNVIITDAPLDNNGKGEAFSPTDLLATSLVCCMITIMGIKAQASNIDITGIDADVTKIMASDPRRVGEIQITLKMPAKKYTKKDKKILEAVAATCPVALSLHPDLKQTVEFVWQ